jgi:O-antigen/teichoic acid export membrane protein
VPPAFSPRLRRGKQDGFAALTAGVRFWVSREVAQGRSAAEVRAVIARHLRGVVGCSLVACGLMVGWGGFDDTAAALTTVFLAAGVTTGALYPAVPIGMQQMGRASNATGTGAAAYALAVCVLLVIEVRSVPLVMLAAGASGWIAAGLVLDLVRRLPKPMVTCNVILIPQYGIVGASWGSAVGYVVAAAVLAVTWKRVTEGTVRSLVCLRRDDLAGALRSLRPGHDASR